MFVVPLLITLIPVAALEALDMLSTSVWKTLVPISVSICFGELLAGTIQVLRRRLYLDEMLEWIIHAWRSHHQIRAKHGADKALEELQPKESPNLPDADARPQLIRVLQVVREDVIGARSHFHTWWTLRTLGRPEYQDVMNDDRYADFFNVSISGHYKLIFASLARVFDRYSSVAGVAKLKLLLVESERRDLARSLSKVVEERDALIRKLSNIGNLTVLHSELSPRDRPTRTTPPITAEEIRDLIDALSDTIDEIAVSLGHKGKIPSGFRYEEAVLNLLELLRNSRVEYELSNA